jgi:two-component system sensor histidine kinase KdpD
LADAKLIEQAVGNAVANAIAHTPAETLILIDGDAADGAVTLRVTDNGPGISPEVLPHIFEKFVRARSAVVSLADGGEGTGLGLTIARGIMQAHGGEVTAESPVASGHGVRVIFTFPRGETSR